MSTTAAAKERPILFSSAMVRAILDGSKTQTRRVVKPQPTRPYEGASWCLVWKDAEHFFEHTFPEWMADRCPYGRPGDRLWVRESAYIAPPNFADAADATHRDDRGRPRVVAYAASMDGEAVRCVEEYGIKKTPSIHVPKWASRITLEIAGVRVERLAEISEADAIAEGCRPVTGPCGDRFWAFEGEVETICPISAFARLWGRINGARPGCSWADSPSVWVVSFRRLEGEAR